jgi:hypothetical protein
LNINKTCKNQTLYDLFPKVGTKWTIDQVLEVTKIQSVASLRVTLSEFRNLVDGNAISINFASGYLIRTA